MEHGQKQGTFHREAELSLRNEGGDDGTDPKFFPEPLEDQSRTNLLSGSRHLALVGQNQQSPLGKAGKRANQGFDFSLFGHLLHAAESRDNSLYDLTLLTTVFDDLEILVVP